MIASCRREGYPEALPASKASKRVFLRPKRVLHNGLVKRPSELGGKRVPEAEQFGASHVDGAVPLR